MDLGDREFTSEEVAALCGVTRVTVADWIARGELSARWTSGGHRRIPRASLALFMEKQGYPAPRAVASPRVHVLVVDDEGPWRDRIRAELSSCPEFDVQTFRPGVDALLAIGAARPDVLLLDTRMPGFDAAQLMQSIAAVPELVEMIVVALTTWDEEAAAARRFGAHAVLPKRRAGELLDMLGRILCERQRRGASEAESERAHAASEVSDTLAVAVGAGVSPVVASLDRPKTTRRVRTQA